MQDRADAAYFLVRMALALLTAIRAGATFRYAFGLTNPGRRATTLGGALLLSVAVGLSVYDATYNGLLTPGKAIPIVSWIWLFGFDMLLPVWVFMLLRAQRQRDQAEADLARLAVTDTLTGLLNRRGFLDRANAAIARARRANERIAVAMLDIDRFKSINDGFGHDTGDVVLRGFSTELSRGLRAGDILARFGGEEFVILLFGLQAQDAAATIDRLRADIRAAVPHPAGGPAAVTASAGVAVLDPAQPVEPALMAALTQADAALYEAKQAGRDRVAIAAPADRLP